MCCGHAATKCKRRWATPGSPRHRRRTLPGGLRVAGKPAVTRLPLFERGAVEVQDEGSQLLALLTGAGRGEVVVDFCAGAGGKTLALGAMMRNTGRLYAYEADFVADPRFARGSRQVRTFASPEAYHLFLFERDDRHAVRGLD